MMDGWVAVTHGDWFDFLAQQRQREEVNFWSPSDYYAFHGTPGAPFFCSGGVLPAKPVDSSADRLGRKEPAIQTL